jgi:glycosyltransferase involved in cell wall biosynthesis
MKIIQIVENLDKGAVENWLVNVFLETRITRPSWKWTFFCILGQPGRLDKKVLDAGGEIIYAPITISDKWNFLSFLRRTLQNGRYDIIHAHHDYLSGFYMMASVGIKATKIIHVHNNDEAIPVGNEKLRRFLLPVFRKMALLFADYIIGISVNTLNEFMQGFKGKRPKQEVLYYGIEVSRFQEEPDAVSFRLQNGVSAHAKIILFAGRMIHEKNPVFVVEILKHVSALRDDVFAFFLGKGPLEEAVWNKAQQLGVEERVKLLGWSDQIPMIMKSCDAFIFPRLESPKEGLGLVVVEAQCAGLPVFITNGIVPDAIVIKEMAQVLDLEEPQSWAEAIDRFLNNLPLTREECLTRVKRSHFSLDRAAENLARHYEKAGNGCPDN